MTESDPYVSLGHLPSAPLVYTTSGIQFAPIPQGKMEGYVEDIWEDLRPEYPDVGSYFSNHWNFDIGTNEASKTQSKQWKLSDAASQWGAIISNDRLIFHTVEYSHFDAFKERLRLVLATLKSRANLTHVKSMGIRYIDNIFDKDGLEAKQQVVPSILAPNIQGGDSLQSRAEHTYKTEEGTLFLRSYYLRDHPGVPSDLAHAAEQLVGSNSAPMKLINEPFMLLDTDHAYTPPSLRKFEVEEILEKLDVLHRGASRAFRKIVTKEALESWKQH